MLPGDLITYRNTHRRKNSHKPPLYIVIQVHQDGSIEAQSLKTGLYTIPASRDKTIKRPEHYFVTTPSQCPHRPSVQGGKPASRGQS